MSIRRVIKTLTKVRAYRNVAQTITNFSVTKILFDTEMFDSNSEFVIAEGVTQGRFIAKTAGYYQINAGCDFVQDADLAGGFLYIFKNGNIYKTSGAGSVAGYLALNISDLVYLGVSEFIEIYVVISHASLGNGITNTTSVGEMPSVSINLVSV